MTSAIASVAGAPRNDTHGGELERTVLGQMIDVAPVALIVTAADGTIVFANPETERLFGYTVSELNGRPIELLVPEELRRRHAVERAAYLEWPGTRRMGAGRDLYARHRSGRLISVEVALTPIATADRVLVLAVVADIGERKRLENRFRLVIEAAPISMLVIDSAGRILMLNREVQRLYGYRQHELLGQPIETLVPARYRFRNSRARARFFAAKVVRTLGGEQHEFYGLCKDGSEVPVEVGITPVAGETDLLYLVTVIDISLHKRLTTAIRSAREELERRVAQRTADLERANAEKEVLLDTLRRQRETFERLSREDPLTGLANRREFDARLDNEIQRCERLGTPLAVAMLDLDNFKAVNDRFGHRAGDDVLRDAAEIMRRETRSIDTTARHGGEEFALALPGCDLAMGVALCERIRRALEQHDWPRIAPGLAVGISAGVAEWSPGLGASDLLGIADERLYQAKRAGRNLVLPSCV